jgi:predicted dehydrogenase
MAGTAFEEPYATVREIVQSGALGHVVQVCAQKSYPYGDWRPQDEDVDGGLILQNGIHAVRMIEHVAGCRVQAVSTIATGVGNPKTGNLQMAASASFRFEGGGLGSAIFNYLNQPGHGVWGNEYVRVFGTHAFIETDLKACHTRLVDAGGETIFPARPRIPYLQFVIDALLGRAARPFSIEQEFHPTRVVIAARQSAMQAGEFIEVDF